jgi:hypothetical protein
MKRLFIILILLFAVPVFAGPSISGGGTGGGGTTLSCTENYPVLGTGQCGSGTLGTAAYTASTAYDAAGTAAGKIASSISDGDLTHSPDGNSVNDALALKLSLSGGTLTGHLLFTDNTYDIGASGATRPRNIYVGTAIYSPTVNISGGTASTLIGLDGSKNVVSVTSGSLGNDAPQIFDVTHPTRQILLDPSQQSDGETATIQPVGNYALKYTLTGDTNVTFPLSGTILTTEPNTGLTITDASNPQLILAYDGSHYATWQMDVSGNLTFIPSQDPTASIYEKKIGDNRKWLESYSDTNTDYAGLVFRKSHNDTLGTLTATTDGEQLTQIIAQGTAPNNGSPAFVSAAKIIMAQVGTPNATDTTVGSKIGFFVTPGGTTFASEKVSISGTGEVTITDATNPQLRLQYDDTHYVTYGVGSSGNLTMLPNVVSPIFYEKVSGSFLRYVESFSDTTAEGAGIVFTKSHSDTVGTLVSTEDTEVLFQIIGQGTAPNSGSPLFVSAAKIMGIQVGTPGATDTKVGAKLLFQTSPGGGQTILSRLTIDKDGNVIQTPPSAQTIAAGNTITADACGGIKQITASGAVTTDMTNTFTTPVAGLSGCIMHLVNVGAQNITLDTNTNFKSAGAADVVMTANDAVTVGCNGTYWYQLTPLVAN